MSRTILMLEHDEDDRYITQSVFDDNKLDVSIQFASNSNELTGYLEDCIGQKKSLPSLILVNYHAFPLNALEIIKWLKSKDNFRYIPVIVLSGSVNPEIIRSCYAHGANSFIKKPSLGAERKILTFVRYWFDTVQLV
jgi:CheY-like chemotaxis protein